MNRNAAAQSDKGNDEPAKTMTKLLGAKLLSALLIGVGLIIAAVSESDEWGARFTTGFVLACLGIASYFVIRIRSRHRNQ